MTAGQSATTLVRPRCWTTCRRHSGLLGDCGYDNDCFRDTLQAKGIQLGTSGRRSCNEQVRYDKRRYPRRSRIEIMFGRLKEWRRVATYYDRCPTSLFSVITLAAAIILWP